MSGIQYMIDTFNEMGTAKKIVVGCCAVWIILMIITLLGHAILGIPLDSYTEETGTKYNDFAVLDTNGDGGLSFDEVKYYDHNSQFSLSQSDLYSIFKYCDKNDNGLLIGGEYDHYVTRVKNKLDDLKAQQEKAQREAEERAKNASRYSSSSSSSHSSSSSSYDSYDGAETCPFCGSEAIYESGGYYKCADCGNTIYNPDDLNLNYDEGYYDLILPSIYYSMNHS